MLTKIIANLVYARKNEIGGSERFECACHPHSQPSWALREAVLAERWSVGSALIDFIVGGLAHGTSPTWSGSVGAGPGSELFDVWGVLTC